MNESNGPRDENRLIAERRAKLQELRGKGVAFPNDFRRDVLAGQLHTAFGQKSAEWLEKNPQPVSVGGRLMLRRVMGKASFAQIHDRTGDIQLFLQQDVLGEVYEAFKGWDIGDIVGAQGTLFRTRTGELSVKVSQLRLLVKSLRPLPDKWHGLADTELRYRQRYVDLVMSEESREVFRTRTRIVRYLRDFLDALDFLEVETPMSLRTPLGRVLGLGAARDGVSHWWSQRLTAVALVPLTLWFLVSLARAGSLDFESARVWLTRPLHSVATLLLVIVLCLHSRLGVQVVVEDYVHRPGAKLVTLVLIDFAHFVLGAAGIYAILRVTFGVAA